MLLVMVTTTLFMASPALLLVLNKIWHATSGVDLVEVKLLGEMSNLVNNPQLVTSMFSIAFALIAMMVCVGSVDLALCGSESDLGHGTIIVDTEERPPWA